MIGGASLLGGGLAVLVTACGSGNSETHGFVYDGGATRDASIGQPGDDDDDDDGDDDDASVQRDGGGGSSDGGSKSDGNADAAPTDSGGGDSSMMMMSDAGLDSGTDSGTDAGSGGGVTCDGVVSAAEYGGSAHMYPSGTQNWYMTWDATNLYVAIDTANTSQAAVMYLDLGPGGATVGTLFDKTDLSMLPFGADLVLYFKSGYAGFFNNSGTGWPTGNLMTNAAYKVCAAGTTRELVVPWSVVATAFGSDLPATFGFLGYVIGDNGYVYGQIPVSNPGGATAGDAGFSHYFAVSSTADGGSTPFQSPM